MNTVIDRTDWGFVQAEPDSDFSPEHNQRVLDATIQKGEMLHRAQKASFIKGLRERTGAVADYVQSLKMGGSNSNINKYFGKRHLAYLRGQEILEKLKNAQKEKVPLYTAKPGSSSQNGRTDS